MKRIQVGDRVMWIHQRRQEQGGIEVIAARVLRIGVQQVMVVMAEWSGTHWKPRQRWVPAPEIALRSTTVPFLDEEERSHA